MHAQFLTKNGRAAMHIARDLIGRNVGERIPRVGDYAAAIPTGRGTVQAALAMLADAGAARFESRGHLGTYVTALDYPKLWSFSGFGAPVGVMPLPYSRRYEGLATGLYEAFTAAGIPFSLAYMRGAETRLRALASGRYDLIVISGMVAEEAREEIEVVFRLGPRTYVSEHVVLSAAPGFQGIEDGMKVGIDPLSPDQVLLTRYECAGKQVTFVEMPYTQLIAKLQSGEIDAAVWNNDESRERHPFLRSFPLTNPRAKALNGINTEAVIAVKNASRDLAQVLRRLVDPAIITAVQQEVLAGRRVPGY